MNKFFRYGFIGILFPLLVQYVVYFQFTPNYTQDLFSEQSFVQFYGSSVYKSRQLGKQLHLWVYHTLSGWDKMKKMKENPYNIRRLEHLDKHADIVFYLTYFFIAAFFSVLTALMMLYLFDQKGLFLPDKKWTDLVTCFFVLLIGFTQFVVTPYDTIGYFFEVLGLYLFLRFLVTRNVLFYIGLLVTIVVATLNRETSLLILSFMAAVYYSMHGTRIIAIRNLVLPVLCFLAPYLFLKLAYGGGSSFTDQSQLLFNLNLRNPYSMMGFLFAAFSIYLMYRLNRNRPSLITAFLFCSLPYVLIIFIAGITQEFRLWMPLIQGALVLALLEVERIKGKNLAAI